MGVNYTKSMTQIQNGRFYVENLSISYSQFGKYSRELYESFHANTMLSHAWRASTLSLPLTKLIYGVWVGVTLDGY
jgi:hypothetical protein